MHISPRRYINAEDNVAPYVFTNSKLRNFKFWLEEWPPGPRITRTKEIVLLPPIHWPRFLFSNLVMANAKTEPFSVGEKSRKNSLSHVHNDYLIQIA